MVTSNRLRAFSRVLPNIDFARNVVVLAGGTTISQGILAITAPIITRLYTPDAFGTWSLFISLAGVLSTIACLRYELSIMLPQDGKKAAELSVLSAGIAVLLSIFLLVIVAFFRHQIAHLLGSPDLTPWLWGLPLIFLLMGLYEVGNYWSTRKKLFSRLAISRIGQSLGVVGTQIGAALSFSGGVSGLLWGTFVGQVVATGILGLPVWKEQRQTLKNSFSFSSIPSNLYRYRNFPFYTAPYGFIASFSQRSLFLLIGIFATNQAVGLFALAMKITYLPMTLISTALRQVFYQKAAMQLKSGNLEPFVFKALALITVATTPLLVFFLFNAHWLFSLVFGDAWKEAAIYAIWLVLGGFMLLITSWLDRVFDVLERQRLALTLQTTYDLVSLGIFALVLMWSRKPVWAVAIYGVVTTIYNVIYLVVIYRIARFPLAGLLRIGAIFLGIISFTCVIHWTTIMLFTPVGAAVTYVVSMTIIYGLLVARFIRKKETG